MAVIPASENVFPIVRMAEVAAPGTPPAGEVHLYALADGTLAWKDDAGTVYPIAYGAALQGHLADASDAHDASAISVLDTGAHFTGTDVEAVLAELATAGGSGIPATIVDAKGDLIAGTAADTVARLAAGANGLFLKADSTQTTGLVWATPAGGIDIPGLAGSADRMPGSPNAADQEFGAALSGWTNLGTPDTADAHTRPSHYHVKKAGVSTQIMIGSYHAWTPSNGDTITFCIPGGALDVNYCTIGAFVGEATPGKAYDHHLVHDGNGRYLQRQTWTNPTTALANTNYQNPGWGTIAQPPLYLRYTYNNSTSLDTDVSSDGYSWFRTSSAVNIGFTIGSFGLVATNAGGGSTLVEMWADWIRVNWAP